MKKTLFTNAKLKGVEQLQDLYIVDGKFKEIGPDLADKVQADETINLEGKLVVPPYCDPHIHLDYVFTALNPAAANKTGSLFEGIQRWSETKGHLTKEEIKDRAKQAMKQEILTGVQHIRTHVDVTDPKLTALQAMLELREEVKDTCDLQIIAFPQEGMYAYKGGDELVEEALKMGADLVGAIPHFEFTREDGVASVKKAFELAVKYDKMVDIHCDETDDDQSRFIEVLAAEALRTGIGDKATASHTCAMHSYNNAYTYKLFKLLGLSKVNFISCPTENIHLQGRFDAYPKRRGLTRVKELNEAGINVCFAQDSMSDPWYPVGNGNLMNILDAGIHIAQMMSIEEISNALDLITVNGARTLHILDRYGIEAGKPANFIVLNAKGEFEAVCNRVSVACSVRNGEYLFKREPEVITTDNKLLSALYMQ